MKRSCLKCGRKFKSLGIFNRLCNGCNQSNQMLSARCYGKPLIDPDDIEPRIVGRRLLSPLKVA